MRRPEERPVILTLSLFPRGAYPERHRPCRQIKVGEVVVTQNFSRRNAYSLPDTSRPAVMISGRLPGTLRNIRLNGITESGIKKQAVFFGGECAPGQQQQ
ncbi:hypothetical protein SDC9_130111 [bioreactor metagenome]|uniref:Uncharacterized protein n=1 Tax=bioreactor metagenome TaxID=1076179 RepID=A0A645D1V8_9ZZZZ